ncbi:ABC transporter ATP-binding protein [Erysipelotrichaceae bacterium MTC7]|nr:ABC transporter ATP-binding protein [Erysipelotrichaceae bacterium MTC7]
MEAIVIENLEKIFPPDIHAVDQIRLQIAQGEVFGFLGPNGAGKTTMVKLLNGMLEPTAGSASIMGLDPLKDTTGIHAISGVLTEHAMMYDQMSAVENLQFFGEVFGLQKDETTKRALELLQTLQLDEAKDQKLATYSTGMRQRLSLARALIHKPKILFLDEPTSGLDPESAMAVNQLIQQLANQGVTIFLCTHQLRYAQELCTNYGLISQGKLLATGTLEQLRKQVYDGYTVRLKSSWLPDTLHYTKIADDEIEFQLEHEEDIAAIIRDIVMHGGNITHVSSRKMSLEEIYFALMKEAEGERK